MKATFKDYLSIVAALLAIFLCGYGIGFLFGERKGLRQVPTPPPPPTRTSSMTSWEETTLSTLRESIDLTDEQLAKVKEEIAASSQRIQAARKNALDELKSLHQRLKLHLTPEQWEQLRSPQAPEE